MKNKFPILKLKKSATEYTEKQPVTFLYLYFPCYLSVYSVAKFEFYSKQCTIKLYDLDLY